MHQLAVALAVLVGVQQAPVAQDRAATAQLAQAEARYRSAIAINPRVAAYHQSLARVLERQGRHREALESHRVSVALDSLSARNRAGYGTLLLRVGKASDAAAQLAVASKLDPTSVEIRKEHAAALVQMQRPEEAAAALKEALALAPQDSAISRALTTVAPSAPGETGYHDYSEFEGDYRGGWLFRRVLQWIFAVILSVAALALVAPIVGTAFLLGVRLPYERLRRRTV
jgi:tetratricopeptide (TPR) repeat protein